MQGITGLIASRRLTRSATMGSGAISLIADS
jgi:hypothetical protein